MNNPWSTIILNKYFAHCCNEIQLTETYIWGRNHGLIAINRHVATDSNGALVLWCLYCNISQDACELSKPFRAICPNNPTVSSPNTLLCKETPFIFIRANSPDGFSPAPPCFDVENWASDFADYRSRHRSVLFAMHNTWKAKQGLSGKSNVFVNSDKTFTDRWEAKQPAPLMRGWAASTPLPALQGVGWGRGWISTYWWEIRPAGDTESKLMREQRGTFKKEGVEMTQMGDSVLEKCWWTWMDRHAPQWCRSQVPVPFSWLSFHIARLLIANFNRNNNKKQVMKPGSFTARKNVIKK